MSVIFPLGGTIDFGTIPVNMRDVLSRTICGWYRLDVTDGNGKDTDLMMQCENGGNPARNWGLWIDQHVQHVLVWEFRSWATHKGQWIISHIPAVGAWHHIAVSYDCSSIANDPKFYIDGVLKGSGTETDTPAGAYTNDPVANLHVGGENPGATNRGWGSFGDVRFYNRVLSDAEIAAIALEDITTAKFINELNLIFHPPLTCAQGLTHVTFPGAILAAANKLVDRISCVLGTPGGSPVGE